MSRACRVCGSRPAAMHGRCRTCDAYWRRTGRERPEELLIREGRRDLERRQESGSILLYLGRVERAG